MLKGIITMENSTEVSQKIKNIIIVWSRNPTLGYLAKKKKKNRNQNLKKNLHSYVHWIIIHNSQDMETTQISINR